MAVEYSLDQRLYRLNITRKDFIEICQARGIKMHPARIRAILANQSWARENHPEQLDALRQVVSYFESKRGITDIYFDER
jgi:hypothetical protein